ncbi:MAG: NUDIX domain-containing protein [Gloeocapsa sp. DLM2.Bin57]|nr:MAG: NUDIX domain-containing protein [Gloeocapsa sp. DLM2.Bin57]
MRIVALGLIRDRDRIFLSRGWDSVTQRTFYRALGGGVDWQETSLDALKREFREEIAAELTNINYLGCIENIFTLEDQPKHEIIQLYSCDFLDPHFYQLQELTFTEKTRTKIALWVDINSCLSRELTVVPEEFLNYL